MKRLSKVALVKTGTALLGMALLAACGGGDVDATAASVSGAGAETAAVDVRGAPASWASPSSANPAAATPPLDPESVATALELESLVAALRNVGDVLTAIELPLETAGAETDADFDPSLVANTVHRLSVTVSTVTLQPQFVKFTQEGHTFVLPTSMVLRYGDPVSNRWVTQSAAAGNGECSNNFFRSDPAPGTLKVCQASATTVQTIAIDTSASYSPANGQMPVIDLSQIPTPWTGFSTVRLQSTTEIAPPSDIGNFRTACGVAKLSFDDPIVYPGQAGKAHLHTFFGNTGVNANSTPDSLRTTGNSTCRGGIANRSAYWVPSMIDTRTGSPVIPTGNGVYYKTGYDLPTSSIRPIPAGLRMIAGTASASTRGGAGYRFRCSGGPNGENDKYGSEIPNCDAGASLIQEIFFPQCWDGVNLDSPDHKSHMAYPSNFKCPADHPVAIPSISFNVEYIVPAKNDPLSWRLSSDNYDTRTPGGYSSHGDWFNGWQGEVSDAWAKGCVRSVKDCHSHLVGDGRMMY